MSKFVANVVTQLGRLTWLAGPVRFRWLIPIVIWLVVFSIPIIFLGQYTQRQFVLVAIYALIVSGINLTFGYTGDLALGHVAMFAAGAYTTGILLKSGITDFGVALIVAMAAAALVGLISGGPGLRLSSWSLAISSLFVVLLIPRLVSLFEPATGGLQGMSGLYGATVLGMEIDFPVLYIIAALTALIVLLMLANLVSSNFGKSLLVLRESRLLTESLGLSSYRLRISAYVIGSLPAGAAGTLFVYLSGYLSPSTFSLQLVIALLAASVIGGTSSIWGAAVGSAVLVFGPLQSAVFQQYSVLVYGLFLVVAGLVFRNGVAGLVAKWTKRILGSGVPLTPAGSILGDSTPRMPDIPGRPLSATNVVKTFGGIRALNGASVTAQPGQITAILGANGAGKTTLLNVVSGFVKPDEGEISLGPVDLTTKSAVERGGSGISRTFQTPLVPRGMTVVDVVESGRLRHGSPGIVASILRLPSYRRAREEDRRVALDLLRYAGLSDAAFDDAQSLPLGRRRLLEVVRAVSREPFLLLLDEPAAGLDEAGLLELASLVRAIRDAGGTVLLVEHNVPFVMNLADQIVVMDLGATIATGTPDQIRTHPEVIEKYLGSSLPISTADRVHVEERLDD